MTDRFEKAEREWLDLRTLTEYACVSERTLREWIHRFENPLPAVQVGNKLGRRKSASRRHQLYLLNHWSRSIPLRLQVQ